MKITHRKITASHDPRMYSKEGYWFSTTHGIMPGSVPNDVKILDTYEDSHKCYAKFDRFLTTEELNFYDMKEEVPPIYSSCVIESSLSVGNSIGDRFYSIELPEDDGDEEGAWEKIDHKSVPDSDGFYTDYTLYRWTGDPAEVDGDVFICMFGDSDLYEPSLSYADWQGASEDEAREWFDSYGGFVDDVDASSQVQSTTIVSDSDSDIKFEDWVRKLDLVDPDQPIDDTVIDLYYDDYKKWCDEVPVEGATAEELQKALEEYQAKANKIGEQLDSLQQDVKKKSGLFGKKKKSLFGASTDELELIKSKIHQGVVDYMTSPEGGFPEEEVDAYSVVEVTPVSPDEAMQDEPMIRIEVRAELSYEGFQNMIENYLDPIVVDIDPNSYFDMVSPGIADCYIAENGANMPVYSVEQIDDVQEDVKIKPDTQETLEIPIHAVLQVDDEGGWEYVPQQDQETGIEWCNNPDRKDGAWYSEEYPAIKLGDPLDIVECIDSLLEIYVPDVPAQYEVRGNAKLVFDISGVEYDTEAYQGIDGEVEYDETVFGDSGQVEFNFDDSTLLNVEVIEIG